MTTDTTSTHVTKPDRRARRRFGCVIAAMLVVMAVLLAVGIGRGMWQSEPAYWTQNQAFIQHTSKAKLTDLADRAFNRILGELSSSRGYQAGGSGKWRPVSDDVLGVRMIRLGFDEANAWLAERLDDWLVNQQRQLPAGLSEPMLTSESGQLVVAFRYRGGDIDQVFSVLLSLEFLEDGRATLSVEGVRGGRLPLPTDYVFKHLPGAARGSGGAGESGGDDAKRSQAIAVLLGQQPFDPVLPIDGSRRARIIGLEVDDEGLGLVVQAEPNRPTH